VSSDVVRDDLRSHILTKCTVQEEKSSCKKISSGSVARRDLIPALKG
jgi:hypothetical protein